MISWFVRKMIRRYPKWRAQLLTQLIESDKLTDKRLSPLEIRNRFNAYVDHGVRFDRKYHD